MMHESESVEFKAQFTDTIYKDVIAFANSGGGIIYIGVDDDGNVIGLEDIDDTYTRIANGIRDAIQPDVTMFLQYHLQDNGVMRIEVGEGSCKPYYLKAKGIRPGGVYVRQGAAGAQASPEMIRRMIRDSDGEVFEEMRSVRQDLTFEEAERAFAKREVVFGREKFAALGLTHQRDGQYTNLAWLLSDQCSHTVKVAVFQDEDKTIFRDSREFHGSLLQQMEDVFSYLQLCNRTSAVVRGLIREEQTDYPEEAVREAMLNALVHREYGFSGSVIINVTDRAMEFISLGGLVDGLTVEDIRSGISQSRNRKLAGIFYRLRLIEAYGTGIRRIYRLYSGYAVQPEIQVTPNVFRMILPNCRVSSDSYRGYAGYAEQPSGLAEPGKIYSAGADPSTVQSEPTIQMRKVMDYLSENGELSTAGIEDLLGVKQTRAYVIARQMLNAGWIEASGRGEEKRYRLK